MARIYRGINANIVGGAGNVPFTSSFNVASWVGPSANNYTITIPESTHQKGTKLIVQVFELIGTDYEEIQVPIKIDSTGNVIITVNEIPDLRFEGKITIQGE